METESLDYPNIKLKCNDSCCTPLGKIINVLTKTEEQQNLLLTLIGQIFNPSSKKNIFKSSKK